MTKKIRDSDWFAGVVSKQALSGGPSRLLVSTFGGGITN